MNKIIWEIIFYFLFLWLLMMVAYGNRDPQTYNLYKHYQKLLVKASYDNVNERGTWDLEKVNTKFIISLSILIKIHQTVLH